MHVAGAKLATGLCSSHAQQQHHLQRRVTVSNSPRESCAAAPPDELEAAGDGVNAVERESIVTKRGARSQAGSSWNVVTTSAGSESCRNYAHLRTRRSSSLTPNWFPIALERFSGGGRSEKHLGGYSFQAYVFLGLPNKKSKQNDWICRPSPGVAYTQAAATSSIFSMQAACAAG